MASGSLWRDESAWQHLRAPEGCPICETIRTTGEPYGVVGQGSVTWYTAGNPAPMIGNVCVVSKRHVIEPFELSTSERGAFWAETLRAAEIVNELFRPAKINYEIHGNTIPHLHVHLFPRFADDPYVGGPIDPRRAAFVWPKEELARLRTAFADGVDRPRRG